MEANTKHAGKFGGGSEREGDWIIARQRGWRNGDLITLGFVWFGEL